MNANPAAAPLPRKRWVDSVRGICMIAIVLNHTDYYLTAGPVINFDIFGTDALMTFFTVSGYLFYREGGPFRMKRKISSEFRHLVIPYFIFTTIIAVLKPLARNGYSSPREMVLGIVCGQASWFVAARALAGIIFAGLITLSLKKGRPLLPAGCALLAAVPFFLDCDAIHFWNADIALMSLVYLFAGYFFHARERVLSRRIRLWHCIPALAAVVALKFAEQAWDIKVPVSPSRMTSFPVFFADTMLSAFVITTFFRRFDGCRFLNYIGRNSIVFYFLCGGVPLLSGMMFARAGLTYRGNYLLVLFDLALVLLVMSVLARVITRYLPWMIGKTRDEVKRAGN